MFAWRKHVGNPKPVRAQLFAWTDAVLVLFQTPRLTTVYVQVWEEVPVPETPPRGFLIKLIASGGIYAEKFSFTAQAFR
jgi:hypothetical protein